MIRTLIKAPLRLMDRLINIMALKINRVSYGKNLTINGRIYIHNQGRIHIGNDVTINSGARYNPIGGQTKTRLIAYPGGTIVIGDRVGISNSTLVSRIEILVGDESLIGGSCNILDTDFHSVDPDVRKMPGDHGKEAPIRIGRQAFIGAHTIMLKGITVEERSVVPAGSVLRRSKNTDHADSSVHGHA